MDIEIWKDIDGYDGYQISNLGRVKALKKKSKNRYGYFYLKERILTANIGYGGYRFQKMNDNTIAIHRLVANAFLDKIEGSDIVNHIDGNRLNNNHSNLEWVTSRENCQHYALSIKNRSSKYIGVCYDKNRLKWKARIKINGKTINLGRFETEIEAHNKHMEYASIKGLSGKYSQTSV